MSSRLPTATLQSMSEPNDTSPEAERLLVELYRQKTPAEKLRMLFEHQASVDALAIAGIRLHHPQADERGLTLRFAARRYPRELMIKAFDWDPREKGY